MTSWWIGADPGGRWTGLALTTARGQYVRGLCITRTTHEPTRLGLGADYLAQVCDAILELQIWAGERTPGLPLVAVEDIDRPNPHVRITDPSDIIRAAMVQAAIRRDHPDAVIIALGKNGSHDPGLYPPQLRPIRSPGADPAGFSTEERPHIRSAFDIAKAGPGADRVRTRAAAIPRPQLPFKSRKRG